MGCDIHTLVEYKHNGEWITVDTLHGIHAPSLRSETFDWVQPYIEQRNYGLFAQMAGVRGDGPEPRGLPDDLSQTARYMVEQWGGDAHSHSWLPIREVTDLLNRHLGMDRGADHYFNLEWVGDYGATLDNHRLVFWFDN